MDKIGCWDCGDFSQANRWITACSSHRKSVGGRKRCWPGTNHRGFGLALKKYQIELLGVITRLPDFCVMNSIRQFDGNTYNSKIIKVKYRKIY